MNYETKQRILDEIEKKVPIFMKVSPIQYRIRCPICGDSQKNLRDAHCYIKCSYDPNEPLLYNCFKCNSGGMVTPKFLEKLDLPQSVISQVGKQRYNRVSSFKKADVNIITGDPVLDSPQHRYLQKRLGYEFSLEELDSFKIIWDMANIFPYISDQRTRNSMPNNRESISFISHDKSLLLTRFFTEGEGQWRKIKLFPNDARSLYTIKTQFDLFNRNGATCIYIAEGIMDIISVYKNVKDCIRPDCGAFIATLGSDYISGVEYAISRGMFGSKVYLEIYMDNDIDEDALIGKLKPYKWLYKSIKVYRNLKSKDMGVPKDKIRLMYKFV